MTHFSFGQVEIKDVLCSTNIENMHIAYAGPVPPNPAELLGSKRFHDLLVSLRKVYDYILIDTPPLGSVIDSAIVAEECDGAILVIEAGVISHRFAQEVKGQLDKTNCPVLGVVLNKVDMSRQKYYGKYYGRHYGRYYGKDE